MKAPTAEDQPSCSCSDDGVEPVSIGDEFRTAWHEAIELIGEKGFVEALCSSDVMPEPGSEEFNVYLHPTCLYPPKRSTWTPPGSSDSHDVDRTKGGRDVGSKKAKWQRTFTHAFQQSKADRIIADMSVSDDLKVHMQSNMLKGPRLTLTTVPSSRALELRNDELKFVLIERFCEPNPRFALPANETCPLTSKARGNQCDSELNDRHLSLCKVGFSSTIETHDLMVSGFWLPQLRGLGLAAVDERKGLVDFCPTDKRPADLSWNVNPQITLQGIDIGVTDPLSGRRLPKDGPSLQARRPGNNVEKMEEDKLKNLHNLIINGRAASDTISPCCFESSGGAGKHAQKVIDALSTVAHPGCDKDPVTLKKRAVWKTHFYRLHTFALIRTRYSVAERKHYLIARTLHGKAGRSIPAHGVRVAAQAHCAGAQAKGNHALMSP